MLHRQWWPAARGSTINDAASSPDNILLEQPAAGFRSPESCKASPKQAHFPKDLRSSQASAQTHKQLEASQSESASTQHESETLDWQTALLRKLLPNSVIPPLQDDSATSQDGGQALPQAAQSQHLQDAQTVLRATQQQAQTTAKAQTKGPVHYAGIFLDALSTARLLAWAPPKYSQLSADHLTLLYKPSLEDIGSLTLGLPVELQIILKAQDSAIQVCSMTMAHFPHGVATHGMVDLQIHGA